MIKPDTNVPALDLPLTIGARYDLSKQSPENFTLVVMYRGKHCPICKQQLTKLGSKLEEFTKRGINVIAASMDSEERAMVVDKEWETGDLPLAYNMNEETAREWGLYISEAREDSDEPAVFSEPGMFLVRPDGKLAFASVQNAPFTRPPLDELLKGIDFMVEKGYPTRGTHS
ncbi:AhpC/TSA family protein [Erythrobacter sp. SCSIO 43205]|uniref:peroxiredoxin-like family protein n=1 Tax=Erythrobacter sp. SCSIO 43205 TaxID=2779361 RepID=UPI001CA94A35|nr:peroxiredoxin-like family protein [Erythrobacter sp. SCSIO 43205]UAB77161.1 AhpC/TSA family protein [Erythrobacter sp. SCSIO 43205]